MMRIDILTLFPPMFCSLDTPGIFRRAVEGGLVSVHLHNIRDYTRDKHHVVDDYPYGGGAGMVMKPEPVFEALEAVKCESRAAADVPVILLTPQGKPFSQAIAQSLSTRPHLIMICGHYEGVDERVRLHLVTEEISIGDYVLTGGELPAMVLIDSVTRLIPGVLGSGESAGEDSHSNGLLEYPHYTRPPEFRGWPVPEILLSGNHAEIARWRRQQSIKRTFERRPDLLEKADLDGKDRRFLRDLGGWPPARE